MITRDHTSPKGNRTVAFFCCARIREFDGGERGDKIECMKKRVISKTAKTGELATSDIKRYLVALAEDFQGRVSAIAEQFPSIHRKLDEHSQKLDIHTQMIGQLMVDVQEIKTDMKQKIDRNEFSRLEKRVIALETRSFAGSRK